jgi:hypothetical protein
MAGDVTRDTLAGAWRIFQMHLEPDVRLTHDVRRTLAQMNQPPLFACE